VFMLEKDYLALVTACYASCVSYDDKGVILTSPSGGGGKKIVGRFSTAFKFSEVESGNNFVLDCHKESTSLRKCDELDDDIDSLESGICALYGVSCGAAFLVPTLLLPNLMPNRARITALEKAKFQAGDSDSLIKIVGILKGAFCELWTVAKHHSIVRSIITTTVTTDQQHLMHKYLAENKYDELGAISLASDFSFTDEVVYEQVAMS
jgi:hypothetical protein